MLVILQLKIKLKKGRLSRNKAEVKLEELRLGTEKILIKLLSEEKKIIKIILERERL